MALKRLDEEFELKPGTQLLPYMKRLLPGLEGRFQGLEATAQIYSQVIEEIRAAALSRMNEILIPATEDIIKVTKLGFLLGPCSQNLTLVMGYMTFVIDDGPQRKSFTPSPYLIIEHSIDDYAIARTGSYTQKDGLLEVTVTAIHGNPGPHSSWMISSTPGMADSTKLYHDAVAPMSAQVATDAANVAIYRDEIIAAAEALSEAGLDAQNFIRRDGSVNYIGVQHGITPVVGSNDTSFPTTAWSRARMQEYNANSVQRTGDAMSGPLSLGFTPTQPAHAVSKAYVDALTAAGGVINNVLTITTSNPSLRLRPTATGEHRMIEALSVSGVRRWILSLADQAPEVGGNNGSNFSLLRYSDLGAYLDTPLTINRANGVTSVKSLSYNGALNGVGDAAIVGNVWSQTPSPSAGAYHFGNTGTKYLLFDGNNFTLAGGALFNYGNLYNLGEINVNFAAAAGTVRFGNGPNKYITFDGTHFSVLNAGGNLYHHGNAFCEDGPIYTGYGHPVAGTYYFGNNGTKYLQYDGTNFTLQGGQFIVNNNVYISAGGGIDINGAARVGSTGAGGTVYFGNGNRYLSFDGGTFTLYTAPFVVYGNITAAGSHIYAGGSSYAAGAFTSGYTGAGGTYYFGNSGGRYLTFDGSNFRLTGQLFLSGLIAVEGDVITGQQNATIGTLRFGNNGTKYITYNGNDFLFVGGSVSTSIKAPSGWMQNWNDGFYNTPANTWTYGADISAGPGAPNAGWWFQANMRHSNGGNFWGMQQAWGWEDNANEFYTRNFSAGNPGGWVRWLNSNNWSQYAQARDAQLFSTVPVNHVYSDYWTVSTDMAKCVVMFLYSTLTINGGLYPAGACITIAARDNTVFINNTETMVLSGSGSVTGTRTLAVNSVCTAIKVQGGLWIIAGAGLT